MKKVFLQRGKALVKDAPTPQLEPGMVLIQTHYSFVSSGTELATIQNSQQSVFLKLINNFEKNFTKIYELIKAHGLQSTAMLTKQAILKNLELGYSAVGKVITACPSTELRKGDFVSSAGPGFSSHADILLVPEKLTAKINNPKHLKECSAAAIASIALQSLRKADLKLGEKLCIIGLGLIGLITVQLAKLSGLEIIGIDPSKERRKIAKDLGCDITFDSDSPELLNDISFFSKNNGIDAIIIAAPCSKGKIIDLAMKICKKRGKVILTSNANINFEREEFYQKDIDFRVSCSYGPGRYDPSYELKNIDYPFHVIRWTLQRNLELVTNLINEQKLKITPLIQACFEIENAEEGYEFFKNKKPLGMIFSYIKNKNPDQNTEPLEMVETLHLPKDSKIQIALIGAGGFAKTTLLPIISNLQTVNLNTVVDKNILSAINVAENYNFANKDTDPSRPIKDKAIDALVIATPHKEHASQILSGLENNKSIFVEKPICISFQELNQIKKALSLPTKSFICADFNRSHSPMVQKIKSLSENRLTPMLINYKVNAGFLPKHSWINEAENGSRVLGEACHFFELFIFLIDSKIKTISVSSTCSEKTLGENFTATLGFFDGSQASLSYISLGNENLAKERGEFSWEGKSALLDDFYELKTFGFKKTEAIKHQIKDKGHKSLIHLYFDSLKKNERTVIDMLFRRQIRATEISLYVDQMVRQGGGFLEFEQEAKQPNTNTNAYIKEKSEIGHCAD